MSIKFVDALPPATRIGNPTYWDSVVAALRERPGQWAEVARHPDHRKATASRQSLSRREGVESAARTVDGEVVVFARAVA